MNIFEFLGFIIMVQIIVLLTGVIGVLFGLIPIKTTTIEERPWPSDH